MRVSDAVQNFQSTRTVLKMCIPFVRVGNDIKTDLVHVLQNKLDDAVLDVISVMLSRNSLCKLLSEDVHFIQKPNQLPNFVIQVRRISILFLVSRLRVMCHDFCSSTYRNGRQNIYTRFGI